MTHPYAVGPAILLYLFADAEIPKDTAVTRAVKVPCTEASVQRAALAIELVAIALWNLREAGAVTMRYETRRRRLFGSRNVALVAATGSSAPGPSHIEASILDACGTEESEVSSTVYRWYAGNVPVPDLTLIQAVAAAASESGLIEPGAEEPNRGSKPGDPGCDRIAALRPAFDELIERWRRFKSTEHDLHRAVAGGIKRGMEARIDKAEFFD